MDMIKVIEELSLNSWPAIQTMLYDGWILRFANGYTKRSNSVNPLFSSLLNIEEKIQSCEKLYEKMGLDVVFKMTSRVFPRNLDRILESMGYMYDSPTSVQILELGNIDLSLARKAIFSEKLSREWLNDFCELIRTKDKRKFSLKKILDNIVTAKCFASFREEGQGPMICSGLGVLQGKYLGLYNIVTAVNFRDQGYGTRMVLNLLDWGKRKGAETAYLHVELINKPALKIYSRLDFREIYRYWYRIKP